MYFKKSGFVYLHFMYWNTPDILWTFIDLEAILSRVVVSVDPTRLQLRNCIHCLSRSLTKFFFSERTKVRLLLALVLVIDWMHGEEEELCKVSWFSLSVTSMTVFPKIIENWIDRWLITLAGCLGTSLIGVQMHQHCLKYQRRILDTQIMANM